MKVNELIRMLQCCDKDAEIEATWEGVTTDIRGIWKKDEVITFEVDQDSCYVNPPDGAIVLHNSTPDNRNTRKH